MAEAADPDVTGTDAQHGAVSLREVLVHLIEECARHDGPADLLCEGDSRKAGQ